MTRVARRRPTTPNSGGRRRLAAGGASRPSVASIEEADEPFCYITTTGRRTGNPHTIEIWFALSPSAHRLFVLTYPRSDTVRNLLKNANVTVRLGGREYQARARLVEPGTEEDAQARRLVVDKYQASGSSDLESWGATALPVAFELA